MSADLRNFLKGAGLSAAVFAAAGALGLFFMLASNLLGGWGIAVAYVIVVCVAFGFTNMMANRR